LGRYFAAPKLRQLFARYATYCGSSPFEAPATLMLIAHAEQRGVWRIEGGMARLAYALEALAIARGARFIYGERVAEVLVRGGRAAGVRLANGEAIAADFVVANADVAALDAGLFGRAAKDAVKGMMTGAVRSLSAVTWAGIGVSEGLALGHHNVFFSRDYGAEFADLRRLRLPADPTVYVCASGEGRYFVLVNAAAGSPPTEGEIQQCLKKTQKKMEACGLNLRLEEMACTGPEQFAARFPQTGGALYGRALAGWRDSFQRPGAQSRLPGLVLAGGSVHPGPGLPMAAISGRIAAQCVLTGK
jgi:1-hydroxycarotenoid 3,4-desaturase